MLTHSLSTGKSPPFRTTLWASRQDYEPARSSFPDMMRKPAAGVLSVHSQRTANTNLSSRQTPLLTDAEMTGDSNLWNDL